MSIMVLRQDVKRYQRKSDYFVVLIPGPDKSLSYRRLRSGALVQRGAFYLPLFRRLKIFLEYSKNDQGDDFGEIRYHGRPKGHYKKDMPWVHISFYHIRYQHIEKRKEASPEDWNDGGQRHQHSIRFIAGHFPYYRSENEIWHKDPAGVEEIIQYKGRTFFIYSGEKQQKEAPQNKRQQQRQLKEP